MGSGRLRLPNYTITFTFYNGSGNIIYMATKLSKTRLFFSIFAIILACLAIGFVAGNKFAYSYSTNIFSGESGISKADMDLFWQAYEKLNEQYLGEIDKKEFVYGAISGAFASLGDPYTIFLSPKISEDFTKELSGELEGIGIQIGVLDDYPTVIAPLKDSPAQKIGIKAKDKIVKVDDFDTQGQLIDLVVSKIRGPQGTKVTLEIERGGETMKFEVTREKIQVDTVEVKIIGDTAHILINEFGTNTTDEFAKAVAQVEEKNITKIVLDLRNNPGGILDSAVEMAGYFFNPDTTVVIEKGKASEKIHKTSGPGSLKNAKLVVLVNEGSASAAEILAGAIQDNDRGEVVGAKTYGKGTVQQLNFLPQGTSVKITVARWLTPDGHDIDKNGVVPDIAIEDGESRLFSDDDPVLNRAIQLLSER